MAAPLGMNLGGTIITSDTGTDLHLAERPTAGGDVGNLTILDVDAPPFNSYHYTLASSGSDETEHLDSVYEVVRDQNTGLSRIVVKAGVILDFETIANQSRDLWIKATDGTDTVIRKVTMIVDNVNEAPTGVGLKTLSAPFIAENAAAGTEIGLLTALDPDANDTFTFKLTDDAGGRFKLDATGKKVVVADGAKLDFETAKSHQIKVQVKDAIGLTFEKTISIGVTDATDVFAGTKRNDKIYGTEGADMINGIAGNDKIYSLGGDDIINGGLGKDQLTGGKGKDTFVFDAALRKGGFDQVTDFNAADDTLQFNLSALKSFNIKAFKHGKLPKKFFTVGSESKDKNDYIHYDKKKGFVYLDTDGSGSHKGIEILKLKPGTTISADDFLLV
jgi:serralysin